MTTECSARSQLPIESTSTCAVMQSDWVHSPNPSRRFVPRLAVMATARPPIVMRVGQPLKRGRDRSAGATEICRPQLGAAASSGWWAIRLCLLADDDVRTGVQIGWPKFVGPGCNDEV